MRSGGNLHDVMKLLRSVFESPSPQEPITHRCQYVYIVQEVALQ